MSSRNVKIALMALSACIGGCSIEPLCGNEKLFTAASPDREKFATLFVRNCGATTSETLQVGLFPSASLPNESGNLFVATAEKNPAFAAPNGNWVELRWLSNDTVLIRYAAEATIFKQGTSERGVSIQYEKVR